MSRNENVSSFSNVIDLIHSHLDTELRLQVLAAVSGFSPYHFRRIFKGIVGEKLDNFIQRIVSKRPRACSCNGRTCP
ncbi:AraC family transcriptional regulator [Paenibacillus chibensis]|uniref:AraC family transcriptional regulator n=1 Tax=Paenibacillus chibensis TaxID=59846 RepID=A0ABU6Q1Y2_9BACL|nr:AraC family transcriptional regulator [Paenibacillus chibensis]